MINKKTLFILTTLILLALSACQPKIALEPSQQPLATQPLKELAMTVEPTEQPPQPAAEEPTDNPINQKSTQPTPEAAFPSGVQSWITQAKEDLALRESLSTEEIELISFESKVWPNGGLGCPQPGMAYTQVMVEGYLIRLQVGDEIYNYHGGGSRPPFLCQQPGPPIVITKQAPLNIKQTPTKSIPPPHD